MAPSKFLLLLFLLALPLFLSAGDLLEHLKEYEGRWVGEFTLKSDASDYSETFTVEQQYWLEGKKLYGVSVFERPKVGLESAKSVVVINDDGSRFMEVRRNEGTEAFVGVHRDGAIIWLPQDMRRAEDYQTTVRIQDIDGRRVMTTEGFDTFVHSGGIGHVVFLGKLDFVSK